jgi:hypothetical protein
MILAKINVLKVAKDKLFKGQKGTYLDVVLIETPNSQHGDDYMVVQGVTKEERLAGVKGAILGNARIVGDKARSAPPPKPGPPPENLDEDVPF